MLPPGPGAVAAVAPPKKMSLAEELAAKKAKINTGNSSGAASGMPPKHLRKNNFFVHSTTFASCKKIRYIYIF